ncbi:MAG: hypothetical protein HKO62_10145 [Gammaproteobacteria bacterium]|nr:hypothetical protein [Gammaproteobacteria bacterium]
MADGNVQLKRKAKGERPFFFENADVDKLLSMLMGLAGEVSVMRDRMDTIERIAAAKGLFSADDIESYTPDADVLAQRAARRDEFLGEITRIVYAEIEGLQKDHDEDYDKSIDAVEHDND